MTRPLYDAERDLYYAKPLLRGWMHLTWFQLSLPVGVLMLTLIHGASRITAFALYTAAVTGMFGVSALYHRGNWSAVTRHRLERLDHVMIFVLIAASATPEFLLAAPGALGLVLTTIIWTLTGVATAIYLCWAHAPEKLTGAAYLLLGWAGGMALPLVWIHFGAVPVVLIAVGGLLYTAGAVSYHLRRPDPVPHVFGYHEVFHIYVCAAATCQYIAIAAFIII